MNVVFFEGKDISEGDIWGWKVFYYVVVFMVLNIDLCFLVVFEVLKIVLSMIDICDLIGWILLYYVVKNFNVGWFLDYILEYSNVNEYDSELVFDLLILFYCVVEMGLVNYIEKFWWFKFICVVKKWFSFCDYRGFIFLYRVILGGYVEVMRVILIVVS